MNYEKPDTGPAILDRVEAGHRQADAEAAMAAEFVKAAQGCDVTELCPWAPITREYKNGAATERLQTVGEVLALSLDFSKGPQLDDVLALLCNVAYGADQLDQPAKARALIARMAQTFAEYYAGANDE
jgi:hypothetical protein